MTIFHLSSSYEFESVYHYFFYVLEKKYSSLCDLCGVQKCEVEYKVPFNDALKCLKEHGGDIAITTLKDASAFFNISDNRNNFQYICPNGTVLEGLTPCSWTSQLNTLIVTGR